MDWVVVILFIVTLILLFITMILSSMATVDSQKSGAECQEKCHKYSKYAALVSGLSAGVMIIILIVYLATNKWHVFSKASEKIKEVGGPAKAAQILKKSGLGGLGEPSELSIPPSLHPKLRMPSGGRRGDCPPTGKGKGRKACFSISDDE